MKHIKAVPYRQMWLHSEKLISAAPRPGQQHIQVELFIRFNLKVKVTGVIMPCYASLTFASNNHENN